MKNLCDVGTCTSSLYKKEKRKMNHFWMNLLCMKGNSENVAKRMKICSLVYFPWMLHFIWAGPGGRIWNHLVIKLLSP